MSLENQFDAKDSSSWFNETLLLSWQQTFGNIKHGYVKAADNLVDELWSHSPKSKLMMLCIILLQKCWAVA